MPLTCTPLSTPLLTCSTCCPCALQVAKHMSSKDMMHILEVDMIVVFLLEPNTHGTVVKKYSVRSEKPETLDVSDVTCMFTEAVRLKTTLKAANIMSKKGSGGVFNPALDGTNGVAAHNAMTIPLKVATHFLSHCLGFDFDVSSPIICAHGMHGQDEKGGRIIGALQLINKAEGKVAFTELDELFCAVYAGMCVSALLGCEKFKHVTYRADTLAAVVRGPLLIGASILLLTPTSRPLTSLSWTHPRRCWPCCRTRTRCSSRTCSPARS